MGDIRTYVNRSPDTPYGRLRWEQVSLPLIARQLGITLLHLTSPMAPLMGGLSILFSPCDFGVGIDDWFGDLQGAEESSGFPARLRRSLARGGMARIKKILWPTDLPGGDKSSWLAGLNPIVPPEFKPGAELNLHKVTTGSESLANQPKTIDLPETFILYHGPFDRTNLAQLVLSWKWAADAIGDNYPLLLLGLDISAKQEISRLAEANNLKSNLRALPDVSPDTLPVIYQSCSAVFHPAPISPWCGPVRLAMACGKPIVASETALTDAIVGPAAYLAPPGDVRSLGAALVTVIVEEQVAENLSTAAFQRSANWRVADFREQLRDIYNKALIS
jgi:glycosyltransferase involved in cell wall biosynthesis